MMSFGGIVYWLDVKLSMAYKLSKIDPIMEPFISDHHLTDIVAAQNYPTRA